MGNVGSGAYRILRDNAEVITHREGMRYTVTAALVRNKNKSRGDIPGSILTENPDDVLDNPEVDIVAEFLGGTEPARTYILRALENGKTVVTANKVVLANCWPELEAAGLRMAGTSPDGRLVEIVELPEHPWYVGCQFHPEFKSRPDRPHPLFQGFVAAALAHQG